VVVDYFNVGGSVCSPGRTESPLLVDADTVLPGPVAFERFESVPRRDPQI
jgi:hypothetical protein